MDFLNYLIEPNGEDVEQLLQWQAQAEHELAQPNPHEGEEDGEEDGHN